uniref:Nuclease n=1 Tax=Anthonomus grandis TaxID=7044 RepID=A0A5C2A354_ANTGR|nr:nuclease [Anthonomus grandis]
MLLLLTVLLSSVATSFATPVLDLRLDNTASVDLTAVACEINPFATTPAPLLVRNSNFVYPSGAGRSTITFAAGETIDFACPGGRLVLDGASTTLQVATASCVSGTRFIVNNARYLWNQVRCSANPVSSSRYTGKACEAGGREAEIGFAITNTRFARTMLICFDVTRQTTIYSYYDLIPAINQQITGTPRPSWTQGSGMFTLNNVNTLYTTATQRVTINGLLGLSSTSTTVIQNNNYFLSRGHLTARSDFFYAAQQNSTFHFLNALPQWQTFNGFNWDQAEKDVQDYAERNNAQLQVWTGGFNVTTLPHSRTGVETELYLSVSGSQRLLPVPDLFWKVVYNPTTKRGVALIGVNNPYKTANQINRFCDDRSDLLTWLNWRKNDQARGISWACTVPAFRRIVNSFPNVEISGLLF